MVDFVLSVFILAVIPFLMAAYGGHVAAESIVDVKHRRFVRLMFWGIFFVGLVITVGYQWRVTRADIKREEDTRKWQSTITEALSVIQKQPSSSARQSIASELKQQVAHPPTSEGAKQLTLEIGQSTDLHYAFETRFILTNRNPQLMSKILYTCEIQNLGENHFMHLNKPVNINLAATGPIEDLPSGKQYSLYCDFTNAGLFIDNMDNIPVHIWIDYTYKGRQQRERFQFMALRKPEDKTYIWLPRGAGHELDSSK